MNGDASFAANWLALREPADHAARSLALFDALETWLAQSRSAGQTLRIVDLGAGSGSNLRWLGPRLPQPQHWMLVDRDTDLLAQALAAPPAGRITLQAIEADLATSSLPWVAEADLVSCAAFLDLVDADWCERLAQACGRARAACLFVLSVDGRRGFIDADGVCVDDADDLALQALFNAHQHRDKGLGAALGPQAPQLLAERLRAQGLDAWLEPSDWLLPAGSSVARDLGRELLEGWRAAALEQAPADAARIDGWNRNRQAGLVAGRLGMRVGHLDLLALPAAT